MESLASQLHLSPATLWMLAKVLIVFGGVMAIAPPFTWVERRGSAMLQDRIGPNRALLFGKFPLLGLPQIIADAIKFFFKEDQVPPHANKALFWLSPLLAFVPALMGFAVIPFGRSFESQGVSYHLSLLDPENGMGMLYPLAIGAIAVYGILVAAWASNNKWSILAGMRSSAQMVSYEIGLSLAVLAVFMTMGTYDPHQIIANQTGFWNVFRQPLGFFVFFTCMYAETNRLPFDFAECESELVSGFHTEFGSMKFGLLALSEYAHMITASALIVTLYFGGWQVPFVKHPAVLLTVACFIAKMFFFMWVFVWIRWTLPRFRYDQLMFAGWKVILPLSMVNLLWHAWRMYAAGGSPMSTN
jgi:NADH-quinone oxidoreductase subunit H